MINSSDAGLNPNQKKVYLNYRNKRNEVSTETELAKRGDVENKIDQKNTRSFSDILANFR